MDTEKDQPNLRPETRGQLMQIVSERRHVAMTYAYGMPSAGNEGVFTFPESMRRKAEQILEADLDVMLDVQRKRSLPRP